MLGDTGCKAGVQKHSLGRSRARALGQVREVVIMADLPIPS